MTLCYLPNTGKGRNRIISGLFRAFTFSLLLAAFGFTSLHAQTVAYVVNNQNNSVSVIDTSTNAVTSTIPVGTNPVGVVFSPDGTRAYVTNSSDGTLSVIDTASSTVIATVTLPVPPGAPSSHATPLILAITPDGKSLYVPDDVNSEVFVVSTASNSVVATISVEAAVAVAITPDGTRAYVQTLASVVTGIFVIDTASNTVTATIPGVPSAFSLGIADTPNGLSVYVTGGGIPDVAAIATSSNTLAATIPFPGEPEGIAITPDGSRAYVSASPLSSGPGTVGIIDTATNTVEATTVTVGASNPGFTSLLAITPDGAFVYAGNFDGTVSVIDTTTNTVVATITVGGVPAGIAIANLSAPFAAFTVSNLSISPNLTLNGNLTLGANTGGLDFAHQPMTLNVGNFTLTVPPGTVKQVGGNMHFIFHGFINGQKVDFDLKAANGSSTQFSFSLSVKGATVNTNNPATVTLKIGHNSGTATVPF